MPRPTLVAIALLLACKREPSVPAAPVTFHLAPGSPRAICKGAGDLVLADVSEDGVLDAIFPIEDRGGLEIQIGDGKGGFGNSQIPGVGFPMRNSIVAADLEPDGLVDLVSTHHDSHTVAVIRGTRDEEPRMFAARPAGKAHNHGLAVADFDRDGDLDVLTSDQDDESVALLIGDGAGDFAIAPGSPWPVGASPYPPAIGDLDGDGDPDVASPLVGGAAIGVLLSDGKGGFAAGRGEPGPIAARPYSIALGDIDGDGKLDAVVAHDDVEIASVLTGDGRGGLTRNAEIELGGRASRMQLVDTDGNGTLDLVATSYPASILLMLGDGKGGFAHATGSPYAVGTGPAGVAVGDVNGDGKLDLVGVTSDSRELSVWLRD